MNESHETKVPQRTPVEPVWPLLYSREIETTLNALDDGLLTVVIRGARGTGKSTVLRELHRRRRGIFVQGRAPGKAGELFDRASAERANLFVDDLDYLLDPARELITGEPGGTARLIEGKARSAIESLRRRNCAVVVAFMYPDHRFDDEYSGTISNLWQIGERVHLPDVWSTSWKQRLLELLQTPGEDLWRRREKKDAPFSLLVSGKVIPIDKRFAREWSEPVLGLTGGHPALVSAAIHALVNEVDRDNQLPRDAKKATLKERSTLVTQWLELTLAGASMNPLRLRLAALRNANKGAFEVLVRTAHAGGAMSISQEEARDYREVLENECLAYYDVRQGYLRVVGELIRSELAQAVLTPDPLIPDPEQPHERGTLMVASPTGTRPMVLSGQAWQIIKLLYEHAGSAVSTREIEDHIKARSTGAVRAVIQRVSDRFEAAGVPGIIENSRGTGYSLIVSKLS